MVLTLKQRAFLVEQVFRNDGKYTNTVQERFVKQFPGAEAPHRNTVRRLIDKFCHTGNVEDSPRTGRPSTSDEKAMEIQEIILQSPRKSVRQLSQEVHVAKSTVHDILRKRLDFCLYKVSVVHELKENDLQSRINYCKWFQHFLLDNGEDILDVTLFTDEAWFHLSGYVNSQNTCVWSTENPHEFKELPLHQLKIGVWCGLSRKRIIGPIFFDEAVNTEHYQTHILEPFISQLNESELEKGWFQQDNATTHTARTSLNFLKSIFANRIISRGIWPARSPDLTPLDFYLWGELKSRVYENNPHNLRELKAAITQCIQQITPSTLEDVFDNMQRRVQKCLNVNGGNFQHIL